MDIYNPVYPGLYYFDTFTFTTLGTSGHRGPESTKTYANAPWREGDFSIVEGQQQWTVPATGTYRIEAAGAYGATPGRVVSGDVDLNEGQTLSLLVGQQPNPLTANVADNVTVGGGGGTFVTVNQKPLIVASGGDGGVYSTGYLRSELATSDYQFRVSMSADGNIYAAIEVNLITFQFALKIYRYLSGVWTPEFTEPVEYTPPYLPVATISGNGKTVAISTSNSITVYEYVDQIWQVPARYITNIDWYIITYLDISYDGNTIVAFIEDFAYNCYLYVFTKNQDLTWNTEQLSAPAVDTFSIYNNTSCAISRDGTRIFAAADVDSSPRTANVWSYSRTNDTWSLPEFYTSLLGTVRVENISASYDGQIVAVYAGNLYTEPIEGYLYVFENGNLTKNLTFPWTVQQYPAGAAQISYDGSLVLVTLLTGKILVTPSTQITIFDDASGFPYPTGCIDSTASRIVSPYYDVVNPITYFFEAGGSGQPGSFLPSGSGSGISGAGYLTDGQVSNPYFGFLKPQAYVDGGFGNSYWYGHKGEGGFGGGQSPLNKQADLTSVIGYKQFRPTIPLVSGALTGMAISEDANTFLASFFVGYSCVANVYTYNGTSWVSTNLYTTTGYGQSLAMSGDGSVWLINADVWRNGSFETQLQSFTPAGIGFNYTDISRDGNTVAIIYATVRLIVYSYSGSWTSNTLFSQDPDPEFAGFMCAMSADGNTIAMFYSVAAYCFVNVYRRVDGTWSGPEQIYYETHSSINSIVLNVNSDGSTITLSIGNNGDYQYSNGVLSRVDYRTDSVAFSRTDPNLYAWVDSTKVYVPSISLEVDVQVDPAGIDVMRMGSNVLAMSKILTPHAIVFLDMYDPTTTCTANTSVDHGYPHDYQVQITGTQYFNGTWDIVTATANTFTFQAFGGPTVTSGYVSGTTTGISGGGGYTGSPGDGVSSATCYADPTVRNFTDLGAASNTAGTVTISLIDPPPLQATWSWDDEAPWENINTFQSNTYTVSWCESLGFFIAGDSESTVTVSKDGINWSQPIVTDVSSYSDIVSASDKPIIVWDYRTSNDGTTWTYNNIPIIDFPRMVYLNGMFMTSANQAQYGGYGLYTSTDGFTWTLVSPSFQGMVRAYNNSVYVGIDSISSSDGGTLIFSNDLNTWTQTNVNSTVYDIAYGNGVFVAVGDGAYTSVDGQTWNQSVVPDGWIPENTSIIFGNNTFIVFSHYTNETGGNVYTSVDGSSWTFESIYTGSYTNISITYSQSLNYFCSIIYNQTPQLTLEGRYFITNGHNFKYPILDFAWSTELKALVVLSGRNGYTSPVYIYTSVDEGITWEEKIIFTEFYNYYNVISVVWSSELGNFFIYAKRAFESLITIFTSMDGLNWNSIIKPINTIYFYKPFWCKKKGIFTNGNFLSRDGINWYESYDIPRPVATYSEKLDIFVSSSPHLYPSEGGTCGYSYDGSHWINLPYVLTSIAWSHSLGLFIAVGETSYNTLLYVSTDGINWNELFNIYNIGYANFGLPVCWVTWSEELKKFYLLFSLRPLDSILQESSDGYTWTTLPVPKIYNYDDYIYDFFWISGLDRFVVQSFQNFKGLVFSTKAIQQF
jgi:hypothetical protein